MMRPRLGVNIDHVATLRNARKGRHPDPVRAARLALQAGADGITAHLREDRRHIRDEDMHALQALCQEQGKPLNMEMAPTQEMLEFALALKPHAVCLVPERREEQTTEGGLDTAGSFTVLQPLIHDLKGAGIRVSLFIEPETEALYAASKLEVPVVELHTGAYCHAMEDGRKEDGDALLSRLCWAVQEGVKLGLEIHAGHGLNEETVQPLAAMPEIQEYNIGHYLVGEALFTGFETVIERMFEAFERARLTAKA